MPLRVRVELVSGKTGLVTELAWVHVANVTGDAPSDELADYEVSVLERGGFGYRTAVVRQHARLREPVLSLVAKALKALGYDA